MSAKKESYPKVLKRTPTIEETMTPKRYTNWDLLSYISGYKEKTEKRLGNENSMDSGK